MPIAPLYKLVLAEAYLKRGAADEGLRVIDDTLAGMAVTGERVWHSEFHRLKSELLLARSSSSVLIWPWPGSNFVSPGNFITR